MTSRIARLGRHMCGSAQAVYATAPRARLVVLDEIQRRPDLFPILRVLADRRGTPARFLVLGSATPELLRQSSESLAGRIAFHELNGFSLAEAGAAHLERLWLRGGFPRSFLARSARESVERHPKVGASWEGFVVAAVVDRLQARWNECYFWATHAGAELDLLVVRGRTRLGIEIKRTTAPQVTPSMRIALEDLKLTRLDVVHAGAHTFPLAPKMRAVAMSRLLRDLAPLR